MYTPEEEQEGMYLFSFVVPPWWTRKDTGLGIIPFDELNAIPGGEDVIHAWINICKKHVTPSGKVIWGFTAEEGLQVLDDLGIPPDKALRLFFLQLNIAPV